MRHLSEEDLILRYYGEAEAPEGAAAHLSECATCREAEEALRLTLTAADGLRVPERGAGYGGEVWARLHPKLEGRPGRVPGFKRRGGWVSLLAAAAALVAAFEAGRHFQPVPTAPPRAASAPVRERILLVAVGDHLRRSQMVLVELVNAKDEAALDVSAEREQARNLVADSRLYRRTAASTGETAVASVLDDLERVLVEIANGPDTLSPREVKDLRDRIESKGILFKVKVLGSQVQDREKNAVRARARTTGTKT